MACYNEKADRADKVCVACPVGKADTTRHSEPVKDGEAAQEKIFCHARSDVYSRPPKPAPEVAVRIGQKKDTFDGSELSEVSFRFFCRGSSGIWYFLSNAAQNTMLAIFQISVLFLINSVDK